MLRLKQFLARKNLDFKSKNYDTLGIRVNSNLRILSLFPQIVRQIQKAQNYAIDTLIVGRGGGSIEDLWAFNEEIVAREI